VLEQVRGRHVLVVLGYVVMPEHIHLLITEPQVGTVSTVMQALKIGFARRVLFPHFGPHIFPHFSLGTREMGTQKWNTPRGFMSGRSDFMTSMSGLIENASRSFATFIATS
jgi:REP element-mobilizing transposase RayT